MPSENGWEPARLDPGSELLIWKQVPGIDVTLQVMKGLPEVFLPAWAADWNAYIEPLRDNDSASYTPTNSVATSNHLNGTACDLNWDSHPFLQRGSLNAAQMQTIADMEAFYEGWMFWAGRWDDPVDEMHSQMGYGTWNRNTDALNFIARKIRSDGFSTFRRGPLAGDPPSPPAQSTGDAVKALYDAVPVIDEDRAAELVDAVMSGLAAAQCDNPNRIAMYLAQCGHESDGFATTEEYADGSAYEGRADLGNTQPGDGVRFKGRSWIQITGRNNYQAFSQWAFDTGITTDNAYFINNPAALAELQYAGVGAAWYWTVARPDINTLSDAGDVNTVTRRINGGTNGLADRVTRYQQAIALGDELLALIKPTEEDTMPGPNDVEREIWDQLRGRWAMLGDHTLVEAVAEIRDKVCGTEDRVKSGVRFD
jgi:predicted chitinase